MTPRMTIIAMAVRSLGGYTPPEPVGDLHWGSTVLAMKMDTSVVTASFRYWRLLITSNNGDSSYTALASLNLFNGTTDLALGKTGAECSASSFNPSDDPYRAFNGGGDTEWITSSGSSFPHWIAVDLGSAQELTSYAIQAQRIVGSTRTPKDWKLQGNNGSMGAGEAWVDVAIGSNETGWAELDTRSYTIPPVTAYPFIDEKGHTVTVNGGAAIQSSVFKYGSGAAYFGGSGAYLSVPSSVDFDFGTEDFTIEVAINRSGAGTGDRFIISRSNGGAYLLRYTSAGALQFYIAGALAAEYTVTLTEGTWYHIAFTRTGSTCRLFLDGAVVATGTNSSNITSSAELCVGGHTSSDYFQGYLDDLRLTKGVSRYTAAFTPAQMAIGGLPPEYKESLLSGAFAYSGGSSSTVWDPVTSDPAYYTLHHEEYSATNVVQYVSSGGPASTGVAPTVTRAIDVSKRYGLKAFNGAWSGDQCPFKLEFMDAADQVVAVVYSTGVGGYSHTVQYGLPGSYNTAATSGYPSTDYHITFSATHLIATKIASSNYNDSFTYACAASTITKVRLSNFQASATYSGSSTAYAYFKKAFV